jgi:hypothetical protein
VVNEAIKFKRPMCFLCEISFWQVDRASHDQRVTTDRDVAGRVWPHLGKDHDTVTERVYWGDHLIALELVTDGTAQERRIAYALQSSQRVFKPEGDTFVCLSTRGKTGTPVSNVLS